MSSTEDKALKILQIVKRSFKDSVGPDGVIGGWTKPRSPDSGGIKKCISVPYCEYYASIPDGSLSDTDDDLNTMDNLSTVPVEIVPPTPTALSPEESWTAADVLLLDSEDRMSEDQTPSPRSVSFSPMSVCGENLFQ